MSNFHSQNKVLRHGKYRSEPQRILITGGAGYIGSILTPMLQEGHQVTVLDNFQFSQASLLDCTYNPNLTVVNDDVRNLKTFIPLIRQADIIIPLAAIVGAPPAIASRTAQQKSILTRPKISLKP